ncbi:MAG TPA: BamA/TamA family outer membrane protein [Gemmatimonadales bacterium]|nr:BamA/TamA family outer membrane protein [Gemmatimonadales bacterium]
MKSRIGMAALLLALLPATLPAQYFGRNKVQYGRFDFKIIQTEHFDVYYYPAEREAALDIARMAERSYAKLSKALNHEFNERKPIIPYASHSDFQQTNTSGGEIDESTGGFTDYLRHRNIFPMTGSYEDNQHVLQHEMTHQFQFDIWSRGRVGGGVQGIMTANAPLWFGEGMAEYFSLGAVDPNTAMWLRDAALEGKLPGPEDFYRVFPYRFGQALVAYIGQRWGDEAIGQITKLGSAGGIEAALQRVLGLSFPALVAQWQDAVQKQYLPEIGNRVKARAIAKELLTKKASGGTWHLAPALSPDGTKIAYLSEKNFYFVDLWLADGNTGQTIHRLLNSSASGNFETFRYITSSASFSADGKYLALTAQRNGKDDIVIVDVEKNKQIRDIVVPLAAANTPTWSPDGTQLVFSGLDGGISDLFVINVDGSGLKRLTNDKAADLHPVWSPDGKTIAFTTDLGPNTDFNKLKWGSLRIGIYHLDSGQIDLPAGMSPGRNTNPQWSPDGKTIAFVSDRNGVANIFLHDLADGQTYQITDFYTGVQGITPLSPVLSWARGADKLAFVYFEQGRYDVYTLSSPATLKKQPWNPNQSIASRPLATIAPSGDAARPAIATLPPPSGPQVLGGGAVYRTPRGFRRADSLPVRPDSVMAKYEPVSIAKILDSLDITPPDTNEFTFKNYKATLEPEYVTRPTIGYTRDTFGRGLTGSTGIVLGDMLGDHQLGFAASLNGRINETYFQAQYINLARRMNWGLGLTQEPYFYYQGAGFVQNTDGSVDYVESIRRLVLRQASLVTTYPFSRFRRIELGAAAVNVSDDSRNFVQPIDPNTGNAVADPFIQTVHNQNKSYIQPSIALVFDNSLYGAVGPIMGRRSRLEIAPRFGQWRFTTINVDYRRYDRIANSVTFATHVQYYGQHGRDETLFRFFAGSPDFIRGYTSGSFAKHECLNAVDPNTATGCTLLDQLVGTRIMTAGAELRFPVLRPLGLLPQGFPDLEGVLFYDAGMAWEGGMTLKLKRDPGDDPEHVRSPLTSTGVGVRANLFNFLILRADYAFPLQRPGVHGYWMISLGPTF